MSAGGLGVFMEATLPPDIIARAKAAGLRPVS
jgi:hypothetical protein